MKKLWVFIALISVSTASLADWTQTANSLLGKNDKETTANTIDYAKGLLPAVTAATGTSATQAEGGVGSLIALAKSNLSGEDFSSLSSMVPNLDVNQLLAAAPKVAENSSALTSMLGADSANALGSAQKVYDQFKSLGLSTEQLGEYVNITQGYLQSEGGQAAVDLFKKGLGALAG